MRPINRRFQIHMLVFLECTNFAQNQAREIIQFIFRDQIFNFIHHTEICEKCCTGNTDDIFCANLYILNRSIDIHAQILKTDSTCYHGEWELILCIVTVFINDQIIKSMGFPL